MMSLVESHGERLRPNHHVHTGSVRTIEPTADTCKQHPTTRRPPHPLCVSTVALHSRGEQTNPPFRATLGLANVSQVGKPRRVCHRFAHPYNRLAIIAAAGLLMTRGS